MDFRQGAASEVFCSLIPPNGDWTAELSLDEIIYILPFHVSVIEPLTEPFAHWLLNALPSKPENKAACKSVSLSDTERCRMQHGFYKLQIFCNICGSQGEGRSAPARIEETLDRLRVLSMFPAWEIEEILGAHEFTKDKYANVFRHVAWDLHEERNPKYRDGDKASKSHALSLLMVDRRVGRKLSLCSDQPGPIANVLHSTERCLSERGAAPWTTSHSRHVQGEKPRTAGGDNTRRNRLK